MMPLLFFGESVNLQDAVVNEGVKPHFLGLDTLKNSCAIGPVVRFVYPEGDVFEKVSRKLDGYHSCDEFESRYSRAVLWDDTGETSD